MKCSQARTLAALVAADVRRIESRANAILSQPSGARWVAVGYELAVVLQRISCARHDDRIALLGAT